MRKKYRLNYFALILLLKMLLHISLLTYTLFYKFLYEFILLHPALKSIMLNSLCSFLNSFRFLPNSKNHELLYRIKNKLGTVKQVMLFFQDMCLLQNISK